MEETEGKIYDGVGTMGGTFLHNGVEQECVGIMFPLPNSHIDDVFDERYLTIPAAQALLIDLRDAVEACLKHKSQGE